MLSCSADKCSNLTANWVCEDGIKWLSLNKWVLLEGGVGSRRFRFQPGSLDIDRGGGLDDWWSLCPGRLRHLLGDIS